MDYIWYAGVATAVLASVATHNPSTALIVLGLHFLKEWLDLQHRLDHNRRIRAVELRLDAGGL